MQRLIGTVFFCGILAACNGGKALDVKNPVQPAPVTTAQPAFAQMESVGETESVQFAGIVMAIPLGTTVMSWPAGGVEGASDPYCNFRFEESNRSADWDVNTLVSDGFPALTKRNVLQTMSARGITIIDNSDDVFGVNHQSGRFSIAVRVEDLKANMCEMFSWWDGKKLDKQMGEARVVVTWVVLDRFLNKQVYLEKTSGYGLLSKAVKNGFDKVIQAAMTDATLKLTNDKKFLDLISVQRTRDLIAQAEAYYASMPTITIHTAPPSTTPIQDIMTIVRASTVRIDIPGAHGSGFLIAPDLVLTNNHVAGDVDFVSIIFEGGREEIGQPIRCNDPRDICLVRIKPVGLPYRPIRLDQPQVGEEVWVIGSPARKYNQGTVTRGIVSRYTVNSDGLEDINYDAVTYPGNSGGPVFDRFGNIVAVHYRGEKVKENEKTGVNGGLPIIDGLRKIKVEVVVDGAGS